MPLSSACPTTSHHLVGERQPRCAAGMAYFFTGHRTRLLDQTVIASRRSPQTAALPLLSQQCRTCCPLLIQMSFSLLLAFVWTSISLPRDSSSTENDGSKQAISSRVFRFAFPGQVPFGSHSRCASVSRLHESTDSRLHL